MTNLKLIADPIYLKHLTGEGHPERPSRFQAVLEGAKSSKKGEVIAPRKANYEDILLSHTPEYIMLVEEDIKRARDYNILNGDYTLSTGDAQISPDSMDVALYAVGAVLVAVDEVMEGKTKHAFCIVRPPGHHATQERGMGFCIFNNVAIGARYAQKKWGVKKVAIIDWDVHHGNGTQDIFYDDPSVFYFSTHQYPFYPGTGSEREKGIGKGLGFTLNCPISAGLDSRDNILAAFQDKLIPAMDAFQPELIFISCGFDAHYNDPLGGLNLTEEDFGKLTEIVVEIADKYAGGKVISVLEGGYDLEALKLCSEVHCKVLSSE